MLFEFSILPLEDVRPTEETLPDTVLAVERSILRAGAWTRPILVERRELAVLDGHHRLAAAIRLGLSSMPANLVDYDQVILSSRRLDQLVTRAEVLARARTGRLYPPRTTRHRVPGGWSAPPATPLSRLRGAASFADHLDWIWKAGDAVPDRTERRYVA